MLSKLTFNWKAPDWYVELLNLEIKVANLLQMQAYDLNNEKKVSIIKNWLGREELQFIQTPTNAEKDTCKSATGLFNVLKEKFRLQHNKMVLLLQHWTQENESTQEWMGRLCIKPTECNYKGHNKRLKEQLIHYIDNKSPKNVWLKNTQEIYSEQVLMWTQSSEVQRAQKKVLDDLKSIKDFDHIQRV